MCFTTLMAYVTYAEHQVLPIKFFATKIKANCWHKPK